MGTTLPSMDLVLSSMASLAAAWFARDLVRSAVAKPRPHKTAYAVGMSMFALASLASTLSIAFGWTPLLYKTFFVLGGVLNVPFLALGSLYLVAGERAAKAMRGFLLALAVFSVTLIAPATLGEIPVQILPVGSEVFENGFAPIFAAIGSGLGALVLILAGLVSIFRFWKTSRRLVEGNALIVLGTLVAGAQRSVVDATGSQEVFTVTLLTAVTLIWVGYRLASGQRAQLDLGQAVSAD